MAKVASAIIISTAAAAPTHCHINGTHVIGDMPEIKYKCDIDFYGDCVDCQGIWDSEHDMGTVKCKQKDGKWYSSPCRPGEGAVKNSYCHIAGTHVIGDMPEIKYKCDIDFYGDCVECRGIWDSEHDMGTVKCKQKDGKWYSSPCRPGVQATHPTQCHMEGTKVFADIPGHECSVDFHSKCDDCQAAWDADHDQVTLKCVVGQGTWSVPCTQASAEAAHPTQCHMEGTKVFADIPGHECAVDFHSKCDDCQAALDADHDQVTLKCVVGQDTWSSPCRKSIIV